MQRFLLLLISFYLLKSANSAAQEHKSWDGMGIETNIAAAKMIKHTEKIKELPKSSSSVELNFIQQTAGQKDWHQRRKYPLIGFGFAYTNYGIDSIYGKCFSIYPNLQIPIIRMDKFEWTFRLGFGLGYATKRYERFPSWDTLNTVIGSHFNNYTMFSTDFRYRLNKNWDIQLGGSFSHTSNAAFRRPNLGINLYGAHVGVRYFPTTSTPERTKKELTPLKNRWLIQGRIGLSANELGPADGPLYPVYLGSIYASKRYLSKNKAFAGVDYSYHDAIYAFLRFIEQYPGEEKSHSWSGSFFVGNEFLYGRVGIMLQIGVYFHRSELALDPYYQKLGANFYIIQNETGILKELCVSTLLKTHKAEAELVEVGLGVGF